MATREELAKANAHQVAALNLELELSRVADEIEVQREARAAFVSLDKRQTDILRLYCKGLQSKELAAHYKRRPSSVRRSAQRICEKMGASTIAEACYLAGLAGLR